MTNPRYSVIDPTQLKQMTVLESISTDDIIASRMAKFAALWLSKDPPNGAAYDVGSLEFDPIKINQECGTVFEMMVRDRVNQAARAVTLAFGSGTNLDGIATRYPGGVPRLAGESDDRYRRRIWGSPNPLSPHGVAESYEFWALTSLSTLRDATSVSVRPSLLEDPIIVVTALKNDAVLETAAATGDWDTYAAQLALTDPRPSADDLFTVRRYVVDERRAGSTDIVSVRVPVVRDIHYRIGLYLYPGVDRDTALTNVRNSLCAMIEQRRWLGADHSINAISGATDLPDVHSATVREPVDDVLVDATGFVRVRSIELTYLGRRE